MPSRSVGYECEAMTPRNDSRNIRSSSSSSSADDDDAPAPSSAVVASASSSAAAAAEDDDDRRDRARTRISTRSARLSWYHKPDIDVHR